LLQWLRRNSWPELDWDQNLGKALIGFSYAFFLLSNMNQTLWYITPDMLVQGLVYLSAACGLRLFLPASTWKHAVALGLTLGLGYLAKAAMFPAALLLIGILFLKSSRDGLGRRQAIIALACFCLVSAPLVLSLSYEKHRFTFGDSGKLNYAWFVGDIPAYSGWNGQPAENGTPAHAPRTVSQAPLVLEFRTPVGGTLPIWYDPSYWWEGLRVPIRVQRQLAGLFRPFTQVHSIQTVFLALAAGLAPFCLLSFRVRKVIREGGIQSWILILWPAATCLMYSLVLFNFRYVVAYLVLIGLGAAALLLQAFQGPARTRALLAATLLLAVVGIVRMRPIVQAALRADDGGRLVREEGRDNGRFSLAVAQALTRLGIRPGDEIAVLGRSLDCYYARVAGVRIVAQIWEDPDQIAGLSLPEVRRVLSSLKQVGVKALVSRSKPGFANDDGWNGIPRTDIYVRMIP
jgi:4-amino-4-deoxy-L-arabinose transferase-like glycosyltransferase